MSIWISQLLAEVTPTTSVVAPTHASVAPMSEYAKAMSEAALFLGAGVVLFILTYGRRRQGWSPRRVESSNASLPLWVIGAAMVWCFLAVPSLGSLLRDAATTRPASDTTQALTYSATCLVGLLVAGGLHYALRRARTSSMLGLTPLRSKILPGRAIVAAAIAIPAAQLTAVMWLLVLQILRVDHEPAHAMLQQMERNETTPWLMWLTIFNATLLAPVFEEVLFRGHFQTALTAKLPRWAAIVVTSLLFAGIHAGWTVPAIFVLSVCIGIAYEWTGSLWVAIAVHVAFNSVSTAAYLSGH